MEGKMGTRTTTTCSGVMIDGADNDNNSAFDRCGSSGRRRRQNNNKNTTRSGQRRISRLPLTIIVLFVFFIIIIVITSAGAGVAGAAVPQQEQQDDKNTNLINIGGGKGKEDVVTVVEEELPIWKEEDGDDDEQSLIVRRRRRTSLTTFAATTTTTTTTTNTPRFRFLPSDPFYDDGKYHPGKDDYNCQDSTSTSSDEGGTGTANNNNNNVNGNGNNRHRHHRRLQRQGGWFFGFGGRPDEGGMVNCREQQPGPPPDPVMPPIDGEEVEGGGGQGQPPPPSASFGGFGTLNTNDPPPPPPPPPGQPSPPTRQELARSTIVLNISLAIPDDHKDGIPRIITTVIKDYLRENNVTLRFLDNEYENDQHFLLNVWKPPRRPPNTYRMESPSEEEVEVEEEEVQAPKAESNNNNNNNNNNRRLPEETPIRLDTATSLYPNTTVLSLIAHRAETGKLLGALNDTGYVWVHHTVYLVAHENDKSVDNDNNNNSTANSQINGFLGNIAANFNVNYTKQTLIQDMDLMVWLRHHLQDIVYQDINLTGPMMGPYYDNNNWYNPKYNTPQKQISYIEWSIQRYGIPVAGVAKPGTENWDLVVPYKYMDSSDEDEIYDPAPPPDDDITTTSLPPPHDDDKVRNFNDTLDESYMGPRQWLGMTCLICTVVFTCVLAVVSNEISKRREQDEMWGNNLKILEMAQEDVDYLNVGWRFADATAAMTGGTDSETKKITENMMMMEVFDKRGLGYRDGDSMLMGGYEYKPKTPLDASTVQPSGVDASAFPKTNSYRVDPSVTPFG